MSMPPDPGHNYMMQPHLPRMGYGLQPNPYIPQQGFIPYNHGAITPQPMMMPHNPPVMSQAQPLQQQSAISPPYQQGLHSQPHIPQVPQHPVNDLNNNIVPATPTPPQQNTSSEKSGFCNSETEKSGVSAKIGEKRKLEEINVNGSEENANEEKSVKSKEGGKKTEIANSIQSFIKNLKIKRPKINDDGTPKPRISDHYKELFEKRKKLKNSIISKKPFQSVRRRTVMITNIAPFPSVLEVQKFIRDNLRAIGLYEGAQVEQILVPQVDYYGTPKHSGYAQVVVKDVHYIPAVIEAFTKKIFCERVVNVAQT